MCYITLPPPLRASQWVLPNNQFKAMPLSYSHGPHLTHPQLSVLISQSPQLGTFHSGPHIFFPVPTHPPLPCHTLKLNTLLPLPCLSTGCFFPWKGFFSPPFGILQISSQNTTHSYIAFPLLLPPRNSCDPFGLV